MGKTRDLFKKIRDIKGIFHAKMGTIMDRNGKDLTEAEKIKKRWQEYKELYRKCLLTWITTMVIITHLGGYHSPRVRHPVVHSQVDLRKHYSEQSSWR